MGVVHVTDTDRSDDPPSGAVVPVDAPGWVGPLVGVLSLAAGLVVAELLAGIGSTDASPIVEVGDRVVDLVPKPLRDWAISTFGTSDKGVLLAGMALVLLALAMAVGTLAMRSRRTVAVIVVAAVTLVGALAPLGRGGSGPAALAATLVGGAVTVGILLWLSSSAEAAWTVHNRPSEPEDEISLEGTGARPSRRRFFVSSAAAAGLTAVGGGIAVWLRSNAAVAAERLGITLPDPIEPLPEPPADVSVGLDAVSPFFTPNGDFYRIDTALVVPKVSAQDWSLRIHGMVDREITLDYESLLDRPQIEVDATIACVSNQVGGDLIGNARWLGCRLDDLLAVAGIDPAADQVVGRSVDGFTAGFPTAVLDGRDAIVAIAMNGEPLPTSHGYPARLIVPGLYGYVSATKWLSELEITRFEDFEGYWIPRGWDREAPVVVASRFDTPTDRASVRPDEVFALGGVAWAVIRGVEAVEVRVDDEEWEYATLGEEYSGTTWRQWRHDVSLAAGEHELAVRATDTDGLTQSGVRAPPGPNASSGWHTITVTAG